MKIVLITAAVNQVKHENTCKGHEYPFEVMDENMYHERKVYDVISNTINNLPSYRQIDLLYCFIANSIIEGKPGEIGVYTDRVSGNRKFYCNKQNCDFGGIEEEEEQKKLIEKVNKILENNNCYPGGTIIIMLGIKNSKITKYGLKPLHENLYNKGYLCFSSYINLDVQTNDNIWNIWKNYCSALGNIISYFLENYEGGESFYYNFFIQCVSDTNQWCNNEGQVRILDYLNSGAIVVDENLWVRSNAEGLIAFFLFLQRLANERNQNVKINVLKAWKLAYDFYQQDNQKIENFLNSLNNDNMSPELQQILQKIDQKYFYELWNAWRELNVETKKDIIEFIRYNFLYKCFYVRFKKEQQIDYNRKEFWSRCLSCNKNNAFSTAKLFDWTDPFRDTQLWKRWCNIQQLPPNEVNLIENKISVWSSIDSKGDSSTNLDRNINSVEGAKKCDKCGSFTIEELDEVHDKIVNMLKNINNGIVKMGFDENELNEIRDNEQKEAINKILKETNLLLLTGKAGTGKTYTIAKICKILQSEGKSFECVTTTGRAASRVTANLRKHGVTSARGKTFHQLLKIEPQQDMISYFDDWSPLQAKNNNIFTDVLIIDEASMVDETFLCELLRRVKFSKIILSGDHNQLPPVQGAGEPFRYFCNSDNLKNNKIHLQTIHRDRGGKISEEAEKILNGKPPGSNEDVEIIEFNNEDEVINKVREWYSKHLNDNDFPLLFKKCQVLVPTHQLRRRINAVMQEYVETKCFNNGQWRNNISEWLIQNLDLKRRNIDLRPLYFISPGDKILCIRNFGGTTQEGERNQVLGLWNVEKKEIQTANLEDQDERIYNGEVGWYIGQSYNHNRKRMECVIAIDREDEVVFYLVNRNNIIPNFWFGYGITIHKAQGSEWDYVCLICCGGQANEEFYNRRLLYTGFTRAKNKITVFNVQNALQSWARQEARERNSCLKCKL